MRLDDIRRDISYGGRVLIKRPGFATAAVCTLALGIGASTSMFSVAYGVGLRPLPYAEPDRLVRIYEADAANGQPKHDVSVAAFHAWREGSSSFEAAALVTKSNTRFITGDEPRPVVVAGVSPAFFDVLGTKPVLGASFKPEYQYTRRTATDVILSYAAWHRLFGGRPDIVGASLSYVDARSGDVHRIVGVMPADFAFDRTVDVWRPEIVELPIRPVVRNWRYHRVIARLRPGATLEGARAELEIIAGRLAREFPSIHAGWGITVESLHEAVTDKFGRAAWLLLASVAVVWLVACLNVGSLLIAHGLAHAREAAIRVALGAGTWSLLRLGLAQATWISVLGAALGVLLGWTGVSALKATAPPGIPRIDELGLDPPTLVVAASTTLLTVLVLTVTLVRRAHHRGVQQDLLAGNARAGDQPSRQRARTALILAQCAGATTLAILSVMLMQSFGRLMSVDFGWNASGVLTLSVSPPTPPELRRPWYRYVEWSDRLIARLEATRGIVRAAIDNRIPFSSDTNVSTLARGRGSRADDIARWSAVQHNVTDGYFELMGIRLVAGRTFGPADRFGEPQINQTTKADHGVAIVTERTARQLWPDRPALGQALWLPDVDNVEWREVVGVVEDIQFHTVGEGPAAHVFVPWTQSAWGRPRLLVKSTTPILSIVPTVRQIVQIVEPGTRVDQVASLDALVSDATAQPRFTSAVVSWFSVLSLILAAVGIYGLLSSLVSGRTREFSIRLALGASRARILYGVLLSGLVPALAGGLMGLAMAVVIARTFRSLLFDLNPLDPSSLMAGAAALVLVALAAAFIPARRASRVDPAAGLRLE